MLEAKLRQLLALESLVAQYQERSTEIVFDEAPQIVY